MLPCPLFCEEQNRSSNWPFHSEVQNSLFMAFRVLLPPQLQQERRHL